MDEVRFPEVVVELVGHDGNAFAILGKVSRALRKGGATKEEVDEFMAEADRKSTRLNSSHVSESRMPSSA